MNDISLVGRPAPEFELRCVASNDEPKTVSLSSYRGRWLAILFYPRDFSFVCPTELTAFSARLAEFQHRNCELLGVSIDSIERHEQWLNTDVSEGGLGPLRYPLATDNDGATSQRYGVWDAEKQVSLRGLFLIDPAGVLQYGVVHNLSVGRSVDEVIRVLDALQSGGLCPVSWTRADGTIDVESAMQPGRVIGHYRVEQELGKGAFGSVFSARDERLDREVAIKVLRKDALESRGELLAEARSAAKLQHPNVCTVFAIEEEEGLPLIAMERIDGRTLDDLIRGGITSEQQHQIALGIAQGLEAAHANSIIHGDLKPANVLVVDEHIPKILDFGLAHSYASERASSGERANILEEDAMLESTLDATIDLSRPNEKEASLERTTPTAKRKGIQGTPLYMSPEQITGSPVSTASDVFSFGLVLFEILTGNKALPNDSLGELIRRLHTPHLNEELANNVPPEYQTLVTETLETDAKLRPTMDRVTAALRRTSN